MTAAQRRSSATIRLAMISLSAMDSAMVRFTLRLLCVSDALTKIATSEKVFSHPQSVCRVPYYWVPAPSAKRRRAHRCRAAPRRRRTAAG